MLFPVGQAARADVVLVADRTPNRVRVRRVVSNPAMTAGASVGGLLPQDADAAVPLWAAAGLLGGCSPAAGRKSRAEEPCGPAWSWGRGEAGARRILVPLRGVGRGAVS